MPLSHLEILSNPSNAPMSRIDEKDSCAKLGKQQSTVISKYLIE